MRVRPSLGAAFLVLLLFAMPVRSQERPPATSDLRGLVSELLELRRTAAEEENQWREQRAHLETTLALQEEERKVLADKLSALETRGGSALEEQGRLKAESEEAREHLAAVSAAVEDLCASMRALGDRLPPPLVLQVAGGLRRITDEPGTAEDPARVTERLRLVNALAAEMDRLLGSVHAVKQVLEGEGSERREVDVLYLGGAVGYWVSPDDSRAGLVVRREDGYAVVRKDELASAVRLALRVANREKPAELVRLPLPGEEAR